LSEKTEDEILKLIRLVDRNKNRTFKPSDAFHGQRVMVGELLFAFIVILAVVTFSSESLVSRLAIGLTFLAFIVGFFSLFIRFMEENVVDANFERLEKDVKKDEKPLLKALIKIKAKNLEFDLEQIYNQNKSMFTKEKLLERLYE